MTELDMPREGPPITSKPYTVLLKYREFMDHEIKQLEEVGIISWSMSDWASPILVVPKKEEHADISSSNTSGSCKTSEFNLQLYIDYRKLNSQIQRACHIKANGGLGKVISSYPLPTINSTFQWQQILFYNRFEVRLLPYLPHKRSSRKDSLCHG